MRRLILSQIDDGFDPTQQVAIQPRCFYDRETSFPNWEALDFVEPLADPEHQLEESLNITRLVNHLLPGLATDLNQRHHRSYSTGYWRVLLMSWLVNMTMVARKRYLEMEAFIAANPDEAFEASVFTDEVDWQFLDNDDLWERGLRHPSFDYWLGSLMCEALAPDDWILIPDSRPVPDLINHHREDTDKPTILSWRDRMFGHLPVLGAPGMGQVSKSLMSLYISLIQPFSSRSPDEDHSAGMGELEPETFDSTFRTVLDKVLKCTLPRSHRDDFPEHEAEALKHTYKKGRLFLASGGYLHHSIPGKFEVAHAFDAGEKIVSTQHGTGYGLAKNFTLYAEVEYRQHGFLSWGWQQHLPYLQDAMAVSSPLLNRYTRSRAKQDNGALLFIGTEIPAPANRLNSEPEPMGFVRYRHIKRALINALDAAPRSALKYRPYPSGIGRMDDLDYLNRSLPPPLDTAEGPLDPQMLACKLFVIDYPGTPVVTALTANVPMVCVWEDVSWSMCEAAQEDIELLRQCGLLHHSGEAAAAHIDAIWEDVDGWWSSPEVQSVRTTWMRKHAATGRLWWLSWLRALWKLNRMPRRITPGANEVL